MARSSEWYYQVLGEPVGPVHAARLRALAENGTIATDTLVRRGNSEWVTASSVKGLFLGEGIEDAQFLEDERSPGRIPLKFLLSTGNIPYPYEIVSLVFAFGNTSEGIFKGVEPAKAFELASEILEKNAIEKRADGVINVRFEHRVAVGTTAIFDISYQVFEVFAYGTAVQAKDASNWPKP